jgi:hypothetical protein
MFIQAYSMFIIITKSLNTAGPQHTNTQPVHTGTSIKRGGVMLVLWTQIPS